MTASTESPPRRLPDFFIVGHPKSGTTALWDMLKGHPQIYTSAVKEPYFLADELRPPAATPRSFGWTPATLEEYLSLFAGASPEQRAGEASAPYLWSRTAAGRIAEVQPAGTDHRDPARARELPALPAPPVRADLHRAREGHAQGDRARGRQTRGPMLAEQPLLGSPRHAVLRLRALRRAAAPLPRALPARAGAGADLRRLPA